MTYSIKDRRLVGKTIDEMVRCCFCWEAREGRLPTRIHLARELFAIYETVLIARNDPRMTISWNKEGYCLCVGIVGHKVYVHPEDGLPEESIRVLT
jgi:hypothetical protein